jgi:ADP-ribose pyrophosphatase YjhB (NUDIX family)
MMTAAKELFPLVGADVALFSIVDGDLRVLLVKRAHDPEIQRWALPGGVLKPNIDHSLEDTARRVLRNKISVDVPHLEEVKTFSGPDRDPRGWSVAVLFYALLPRDQITALVKSKIEAVQWGDAAVRGHELAFDHDLQLKCALEVLRKKVNDHALPLHLMPALFTLTALQKTCEAILGKPLDKAVFRRRLKSSTDLIETDQYERGLQRPAMLYRARDGFCF